MEESNHHHVKHVVSALHTAVSLHADVMDGVSDHVEKQGAILENARKAAEIKAKIDEGIARQS